MKVSRLAAYGSSVVIFGWLSPMAAAMQTALAPPGPVQVPARPAATPTAGTSIIRGRVLDRDTGSPLRRASVQTLAPSYRTTRTDEQGRYELADLPAGRYFISAWKASYVRLMYGQTNSQDIGKPLDIRDGQTVEHVDFSLPRGAIIAGRVVDEDGDPVPDVQMTALRPESPGGRRTIVPAGSSSTDDMGEFRIFGLQPGQYYVSATTLRNPVSIPAEEDDHSGYAITYFPATPNLAEAQRVRVDVAQIASDVNIALVPTRTARISGTAIDSRGRPITTGFVNLVARDQPFDVIGGRGQMRPDGTFTMAGVTPGTYTLRVQTMPTATSAAGVATAEVTVNGADIVDVQLAVPAPGLAKGRIVVDPMAAGAPLTQGLQVSAIPMAPRLPFVEVPERATVNDDLTFAVKVPPGKSRMALTGLPSGWSQKSMHVSGLDATETGVDFKPGETVSGIEIAVTNVTTTLTGMVTDGRGQRSKDYFVVVFPQDRERWSNVRYALSDQDGGYKITNLPAGQYYAVAIAALARGDTDDPDFLDGLRARATTFSLADGETKTLHLKLEYRP